MSRAAFKHQFVECMPNQLENNIVYVSIEYATAIHKCACGCGNEVVTPISPTDWKLTYDGDSISLHPSIGNWSFRCRSHYWIIRNEIVWADTWSKTEVKKNRKKDAFQKQRYYEDPEGSREYSAPSATESTFWNRIKRAFSRRA